jgi:hypothetical protein
MGDEKPKASPGPWRWDDGNGFCPGWLRDANGDWVLTAKEPADVDVSEVNAALISRAPDLLALVRDLEWSSFHLNGDSEPMCPVCGAIPDLLMTAVNRRMQGTHAPDCRLATLLSELT